MLYEVITPGWNRYLLRGILYDNEAFSVLLSRTLQFLNSQDAYLNPREIQPYLQANRWFRPENRSHILPQKHHLSVRVKRNHQI